MKFEFRNYGETSDGYRLNDDNWAVVNTDTNETVITGNFDDLGWIGMDYLKKFANKMNQLWEHPEDF